MNADGRGSKNKVEGRWMCEVRQNPRLKIKKDGSRDARLGVLDHCRLLWPTASLPIVLLTIDVAADVIQVTLETCAFTRT